MNKKLNITIGWIVFVFVVGMFVSFAAGATEKDMETALSVQNAIKAVTEKVAPTVVSIEVVQTCQIGEDFESVEPHDPFSEDWFKEHLPREFRKRFRRWEFHFEWPPLRRRFQIRGAASGVIISPDGYILTNDHVVRGASELKVTLETGKKYKAKLVNSDPRRDLAVIKIKAKDLPVAKLGNAEEAYRGMFVVALGSPFGLGREGQASVSFGIISAMGRFIGLGPKRLDRYYGDMIQTDAAINPGNSGGPLCNLQSEVIGINTAITTRGGGSEGVGFAIPVNRETRQIIDKLLKGEKIVYGYLGVLIKTPTEEEAKIAKVPPDQGAFVSEVIAGFPADKAGLMPGDVITEFQEEKIKNSNHLIRIVGTTPVGKKVKLTYVRGGKEYTTEVVIAERPSDPLAAAVPELGETWRGIEVRDLTNQDKEEIGRDVEGVYITRVLSGSPADRAGIEAGMIIDQVMHTKVKDVKEFAKATAEIEDDCFVHVLGKGIKIVKAPNI